MTPPRQQGFCGSCWAFASADAIISRLVIKKKVKKLKPLSVSHLMDCVPNQMGCEGGNLGPVFEHIRDKGGLYEEDYRPYDETVKNCAKATGSVGKKQYKSIVSLKFPSVAYASCLIKGTRSCTSKWACGSADRRARKLVLLQKRLTRSLQLSNRQGLLSLSSDIRVRLYKLACEKFLGHQLGRERILLDAEKHPLGMRE